MNKFALLPILAILVACAEAPSPPRAAVGPVAVAKLPGEDFCSMQADTSDLKVCRTEVRLRAARRGAERAKAECYDERVGQMHAAQRERMEAKQRYRERAMMGFGADEKQRQRISEVRISELWDQIQSGICEK